MSTHALEVIADTQEEIGVDVLRMYLDEDATILNFIELDGVITWNHDAEQELQDSRLDEGGNWFAETYWRE